jgi:UDP-N-acetylglucosamine pyrophosphorylase
MTSPFTDAATRKFFETRRYFGLDADQVRPPEVVVVLNIPLFSTKCKRPPIRFMIRLKPFLGR